MARLNPGITLKQAQAGMDTVASRLEKQYSKTNTGWKAGMMPLQEVLVRVLPAVNVGDPIP